jgi:hypothetical protein
MLKSVVAIRGYAKGLALLVVSLIDGDVFLSRKKKTSIYEYLVLPPASVLRVYVTSKI